MLLFGITFLVMVVGTGAWMPHPMRSHQLPLLSTLSVAGNDSADTLQQQQIPFFGGVYRLGGGEDDADRSFVDRMGVPTFVAVNSPAVIENSAPTVPRTLPGVQPGPALVAKLV